MFKLKKINNKKVYYSDLINAEHFFTTRELIVKDNIDVICDYLKIETKNLIHPHQVHSDVVEIIQENQFDYDNCDGLITNISSKAIYLNFADCVPVILYDERNNVSSVVHAGWRGSAKSIVRKAVKLMYEKFNSIPNEITAAIGPCISFSHFETSDDAINFLSETVDDKKLFNNNYADLKGINKRQLELSGVKKIDVCEFCTIDDNDKFFSYRLENKTKNRHSAIIKPH